MDVSSLLFLLAIGLILYIAFSNTSKMQGYTLIGNHQRKKQLEEIPGYRYFSYSDLNIDDSYIHTALLKHFAYYAQLEVELQQKFLKRTVQFLRSKMFVLPELNAYSEMPILAAAVAIQLTFGRKEYMFDRYHFIRIHPQEYFKNGTLNVLAGHVYGNTITLAWNFFLHGVNECADGKNVGLHEMTHAFELCYLCEKKRPHAAYETLCEDAQNYIARGGAETSNIFSAYAHTNKHEFIAEAVELFFEKPNELRTYHPAIFHCLSSILNQDPTVKNNPLAVMETSQPF